MNERHCPLYDGRFSDEQLGLTDRPYDGTCGYCGGLLPEVLFPRLEAGDVELVPTDKAYKVYARNKGGEPFAQAYRTSDATGDRVEWKWEIRPIQEVKAYFEHFDDGQKRRLVELLNAGRLRFADPGRFYVLPYFVEIISKPTYGVKGDG